MSYSSTSVVNLSTTAMQVREIVKLLGYRRIIGERIPNLIGSYYWFEEEDYRSWAGVRLEIYKAEGEPVRIDTSSPSSRSYWDLLHQNRTLKLMRDLLGGHFETDAGRNRYWRPDAPPPPPISSGCYLARWRLANNLGRVRIYLMTRRLEGPTASNKSTGLEFMDQLNPRLLSNNILVPYMIAAWEEFFRSSFVACLRYSNQRSAALKRAKLSHSELEKLVIGASQVERSIAEGFSFQRPSVISENFKLVEPRLDIAGALRRPYRGRKVSLFESLEKLVEGRNNLVHTGELDLNLYDKRIDIAMNDLTEAANRAYNAIAKHYGFVPNHVY